MEMCDRKKEILRAIIEDYIETAEPIGSRTIARRHEMSLSPATIRNEMADLEEMGYLEKPHTSAGRVPSDTGYRFYVNSLMRRFKLSTQEATRLCEALELRMRELDDLITETSDIVSRITEHTVIASSPRTAKPVIQSIYLLPVSGRGATLAVITSGGVSKNALIETSERYADTVVYNFSQTLSEALCGRSPHDIGEDLFEIIKLGAADCRELLKPVLSYLYDWFDQSYRKGVYSGGSYNIFNYPEYKNIERAKEFIKFIDNRDNIYGMVYDNENGEKIKIKIGSENNREELRDCSVIISNYSIGNLKGSIGIIGPMRMDYAKIVSSLEVVTQRLNFVIQKMFFDE